jgi:hypothetical protein
MLLHTDKSAPFNNCGSGSELSTQVTVPRSETGARSFERAFFLGDFGAKRAYADISVITQKLDKLATPR